MGGNRVDRFIGRDYRRHYHQRSRFDWLTANQLKSKFRCEPVFDSSGKVIGARSVYDHLRFQEICGGGCSTDSVANYMGSTTASVSSGKCGAKVTFLLLTSDWRVVLSNQNRCETNWFLGWPQCWKLYTTFKMPFQLRLRLVSHTYDMLHI